jgi:glucosamine--fructose-6-phosphate aminotransferase (isomerizing)
MSMRDEILEQPAVVAGLLETGRAPLERCAARVRAHGVRRVIIAARGTSDHAALYALYAFGVRNRLSVALAAPSIVSLYGVAPDMADALVIGISQSGASPDVVGVITAAREQGAVTLAITNDPASALADAAEHVVDLGAGPERSVAATKTYTAEVFAVALLSTALASDTPSDAGYRELAAVPGAITAALASERDAERIAAATAGMTRCVVVGRGYEYATAREWALKLKELAGIVAEPYSSADFEHGPRALLEPGFPLLAVAPSGVTAAELGRLIRSAAADQGAEVVAISDDPATRAAARRSLAVPAAVAEWLMPLVTIVPAQLHAYHVTLAMGRDPERPPHIRKVTLTH